MIARLHLFLVRLINLVEYEHMNMTFIQYINNVRLEKSVEQFEQGNISILEVSLSVGFHNLSYFHRAFKEKII